MTNSLVAEKSFYQTGDLVLFKEINQEEGVTILGKKYDCPNEVAEKSLKIATIQNVENFYDFIAKFFGEENIEDEKVEIMKSSYILDFEEDGAIEAIKKVTGISFPYVAEMLIGKVVSFDEYFKDKERLFYPVEDLEVGELYAIELEGSLTAIKLIGFNEHNCASELEVFAEVLNSKETIRLNYSSSNIFRATDWYKIVTPEVTTELKTEEIADAIAETGNKAFEETIESAEAITTIEEINNKGFEVVEPLGLQQDAFFIEKIIFNNPATIVFYRDVQHIDFVDGVCTTQDKTKKVVATCMNGDEYSKEIGLAICYAKMSKRKAERLLKLLYSGKGNEVGFTENNI